MIQSCQVMVIMYVTRLGRYVLAAFTRK